LAESIIFFPGGGIGAAPGIDTVLGVAQDLTTDRILDQNDNKLRFTNLDRFTIEGSSSAVKYLDFDAPTNSITSYSNGDTTGSTEQTTFYSINNRIFLNWHDAANANRAEIEACNDSGGGLVLLTSSDIIHLKNLTDTLSYKADHNTGTILIKATNGVSIQSSLTLPYVAKTGAYTITADDYCIDCTSGTFTVTLLPAVQGRIYVIKNSGTGTITIDGDGSETIDDTTTKTLSTQYSSYTLMGKSGGWIII
jgi:hypothetical protein